MCNVHTMSYSHLICLERQSERDRERESETREIKTENNHIVLWHWIQHTTQPIANEQFKLQWQIKIRSDTINNNAEYLILNTQADVSLSLEKKTQPDCLSSKNYAMFHPFISICCCIFVLCSFIGSLPPCWVGINFVVFIAFILPNPKWETKKNQRPNDRIKRQSEQFL